MPWDKKNFQWFDAANPIYRLLACVKNGTDYLGHSLCSPVLPCQQPTRESALATPLRPAGSYDGEETSATLEQGGSRALKIRVGVAGVRELAGVDLVFMIAGVLAGGGEEADVGKVRGMVGGGRGRVEAEF
jgi:hypothetical protein